MSVNLSKCKVDDKVKLRNGKIARIIMVGWGGSYPVAHDSGKNCYHGVTINGKSCMDDDENDIVKVITQSKDNKVAKFLIRKNFIISGFYYSLSKIGGMYVEMNYCNRRNAIRGARRFCKRIGFECEIVDQP